MVSEVVTLGLDANNPTACVEHAAFLLSCGLCLIHSNVRSFNSHVFLNAELFRKPIHSVTVV